MRFTKEVVSFNFAGIPIIGNMGTGTVVGLTTEGASICSDLFNKDIPEKDIACVDVDLLENLKEGGFFSRTTGIDTALSAYLHVTQNCNLDCAGCYSLDDDRNSLKDASLDDIKKVLRGLCDANVKQLIISGGEPFLRADLPNIVKLNSQ